MPCACIRTRADLLQSLLQRFVQGTKLADENFVQRVLSGYADSFKGACGTTRCCTAAQYANQPELSTLHLYVLCMGGLLRKPVSRTD